MNVEAALAELKKLYSSKDSIPPDEGQAWVERVSELLNRHAPSRASEFDQLSPYLFAGLSDLSMRPLWHRTCAVLRAAIADLERESRSENDGTPTTSTVPDHAPAQAINPKEVFVVHGRNEALRRSLFQFLRALGLHPIEWSQAVRSTGKAAPYIGEILESAFAKAQAVVVLLTPDDEVRLSEQFWRTNEPEFERTVRRQARPNVLFEAGMAFGTHAERTVLVQVGPTKPFSDIAGRHVVRLDNSVERRADMAERLEQAGCPVETTGRDWMTAGDFSLDASPPNWSRDKVGAPPADGRPSPPKLVVDMGYLGAWRDQQIVIENVGGSVARDIGVVADGAPIEQHPCWVSGQTLPEQLRPGEHFGVKIALSMESPERSDVVVTWKDEDDREYVTERAVQLI